MLRQVYTGRQPCTRSQTGAADAGTGGNAHSLLGEEAYTRTHRSHAQNWGLQTLEPMCTPTCVGCRVKRTPQPSPPPRPTGELSQCCHSCPSGGSSEPLKAPWGQWEARHKGSGPSITGTRTACISRPSRSRSSPWPAKVPSCALSVAPRRWADGTQRAAGDVPRRREKER